MPFSEHVGIKEKEWTEVFEKIFKPAIEGSGFGYRCERSEITAGAFTKDIVENMKNAHVVLADITGFNGNVMWELGVRHTLSPRTIMVAREKILDVKVISDLRNYGVHTYDNNAGAIDRFKKTIKEQLKKIEENPDRLDNPVFDFLKIEDLILSSYGRKQIVNNLTGLLTELIENLRIAEGISDNSMKVDHGEVTLVRFSYNAIDHLLVQNYIYAGEDFVIGLTLIRKYYKSANYWMDALKLNFYSGDSTKKYLKKLAKNVHVDVKNVKITLTKVIKETNGIIKSIRKGTFDYVEPKILILDQKHKSLLEEPAIKLKN